MGISPLRSIHQDPSGNEELDSLVEISRRLRQFRADRKWERFHTPRNLAISLAVEAGELLEHFQWSDLQTGPEENLQHHEVVSELADVVIYAVQLADSLNVSIGHAVQAKIQVN